MNINDGQEFFAHEMSANYNPTQFVLDFRCVTPRVDIRTRDNPVLNIKHNVVLVEPWHAKEVIRVLQNVVDSYEKKFGKIEKPKSIKEMEKKHKAIAKEEKEEKSTKTPSPSYFG